jgi:hypothetical protein
MNQINQFFVGVFLFLIPSFALTAQSVIQTSAIQKGIKHYKGRIDDISDVAISISCKGKTCEGALIYVRSRDQFKLRGVREGNQLQLKEFNQKGKCTGYLSGSVAGKHLNLEWKNETGTIGNTLHLKEVARMPDFPTYCGDNKWINAYTGKIKGEEVSIILQRVDNNRILGQAYFRDKRQTILLRGNLLKNDNLHLQFIDENSSEQIGTIRGIYKNKQNLNLSFYNNQNNQSFLTLNLEKHLAVSCLEYADFYTNYDFIFPKSDRAVFNELMVVLTQDWLSDCRKNAQSVRKRVANPQSRSSQRAYSWTEIELLTNDFISGLLTYHSTWSNQQKTKTFNYDLQSNQPVQLDDIFKKGFDYKAFVKKYANETILKSALYKNDHQFRNWIINQDFPFFTIDHDGISFYTDFHIVYDRQRILIPYKKLKGNIRKKSIVRKLF